MEGQGIFVEEGLARELRSGQTGGVQEADGPEATSPQGELPPEAPLALSCLVKQLRETGPRSAHNAGEKGQFQAGAENREE